MCPDRQILSVYLDGELSSPWKEKMESHLARCPQCRERLEKYRLIAAPPAIDAARMEAAQERIWRNLEDRQRFRRIGSAGIVRGISVWRRSISVPLPAAAAAAAVLVIACAALWTRKPAEPAAIPQMSFAVEQNLESPGIIPVADMNGVLRLLDNRDNGDMLIIDLPKSRNFASSGEPVILKAADYRRQP